MRRKFCTFAADFIKTLNIMKPSYFILALLCAFSMAFVACENNDPDTKKGGDDTTSQHQPANPATWSPNGKTYVCDRSDRNPYNVTEFWEVIRFTDAINAVYYGTTNKDLTPVEDNVDMQIQRARYATSYPALTLDFEIAESHLSFTDTLTLKWGENLTYYLR